MATRTRPLIQVSTSVGRFTAHVEYEPTDSRRVDEEGQPRDFKLARIYGENQTRVPVTFHLARSGRRQWKQQVLAPGGTFEFTPDQAVAYEFDIPEIVVRPEDGRK